MSTDCAIGYGTLLESLLQFCLMRSVPIRQGRYYRRSQMFSQWYDKGADAANQEEVELTWAPEMPSHCLRRHTRPIPRPDGAFQNRRAEP